MPTPRSSSTSACHIEHQGASRRLADVDQRRCLDCHGSGTPSDRGHRRAIPDFATHPEFAAVERVRQGGATPDAVELPNIRFTHRRHVEEHLPRVKPGATLSQLCESCHRLNAQTRDFQPISYAQSCAVCHDKDLPMLDPIPRTAAMKLPGGGESAACREAGFDCTPTTVRKLAVVHQDAWLLQEMWRLQRATSPAAYAAERSRLAAEATRLERRLALGMPLAGRDAATLADLQKLFTEEIALLDARAREIAGAKSADLARAGELAAAAKAAGSEGMSADIESLRLVASALGTTGASASEFETRRRELLELLAAVDTRLDQRLRKALSGGAKADDPTVRSASALKAGTASLRRRVLSLQPGEDATAALKRARSERARDLSRVEDELKLRQEGTTEQARVDPGASTVEGALLLARDRLRGMRAVEAADTGPVDPTQAATALRNLIGVAPEGEAAGTRCLVCHVVQEGAIAPVRAAERVLVLSSFAHAPHLTAAPALPGAAASAATNTGLLGQATTCAACHKRLGSGQTQAPQYGNDARELHVPGIESCRECHKSGGNRTDCMLCHRYHPPSLP